MDQSPSWRRKLFHDLNAGSKRKKESLVSFSGHGLEREENVSKRYEIHLSMCEVRKVLKHGRERKMLDILYFVKKYMV